MVGNPCFPSVVPVNEVMRLRMKLDCHFHLCPVLSSDTACSSSSVQ